MPMSMLLSKSSTTTVELMPFEVGRLDFKTTFPRRSSGLGSVPASLRDFLGSYSIPSLPRMVSRRSKSFFWKGIVQLFSIDRTIGYEYGTDRRNDRTAERISWTGKPTSDLGESLLRTTTDSE